MFCKVARHLPLQSTAFHEELGVTSQLGSQSNYCCHQTGYHVNCGVWCSTQRCYEGRSKSSQYNLMLFKIKLKQYVLLIVARLRTRHAQYDFWAINILCILAVVGCLHLSSVTQCNEMTISTNSFVPLHGLLFWLRIEVVDPCFILNNKLWKNFCWVTSVSFEKFFRNLCTVLMLAFLTPIWQTLCPNTEMHQTFIAQKLYCTCRILSLGTIRSKYYINFILKRTRSGWELFDRPSYYHCTYC